MSQPGRLPLSNRGGCPYIRRLRCFGNAAGIFAGSRAPPGAARPVEQGQAMDFDLTDEQRLLKDSVDRLLADRYALRQAQGLSRRAARAGARALWAQYAELGLLGLPFAEEHGGFGGGGVEIMLVMEAFGRALALEPYLATVVLAGTALRLAGSDAQQAALLPQIADGAIAARLRAWRAAGALRPHRRVDHGEAESGGGWVLDGAKSVVSHGDGADKLIVSARTSGDRDDTAGITLFLVDANANGVARRGYTLRDGTARRRDLAERGRGRRRCRARRSRRRPSRSSSGWSRPASRRWPPRRSARWRRCRR